MTPETAQWVRYAEEDWQVAGEVAARKPPHRNAACFHFQQAAEKYLKALVQEVGLAVPRTHDLEVLLDLLLPRHPTLATCLPISDALRRWLPLPRQAGRDPPAT